VRGLARRESSHSTDRKVAEKLLKRRLAEVETKTYIARTSVKVDELIADFVRRISTARAQKHQDGGMALQKTSGAVLSQTPHR
jgi:hypothetical protein